MDEPVTETTLTPTRAAAPPAGWGRSRDPGVCIVGRPDKVFRTMRARVSSATSAEVDPLRGATEAQAAGILRMFRPFHAGAGAGIPLGCLTRAGDPAPTCWRPPNPCTIPPDRRSSLCGRASVSGTLARAILHAARAVRS